MKKRTSLSLKLFFSSLLILFISVEVNAREVNGVKDKLVIPDSSAVQILDLSSGERLVGKIVKIREEEIDFQAQVGTITIQIANIKGITKVPHSTLRNGGYWFPNPNRTRLYFSPTAKMLKQGEGYYQNIWLFFNGIAVGVTDNITLGGGMSIFPTDDFLSNNIFFLTPKIGVSATEDVDLAVGALFIFLPFDDDFDDNNNTAGILYGVGTTGNDNASLTGGIGYGFSNGELADAPMLMLGGEARFAKRVSFVTENWIIPEANRGILSYGLRVFGEKMSLDLSLINVTANALFPGVPYLDAVVHF